FGSTNHDGKQPDLGWPRRAPQAILTAGRLGSDGGPSFPPSTPAAGDLRMYSSFVRRGAMLFALVVPFALHAQATTGTLRGRVTDAASGRGIPEVQVTIGGTRLGAVTGQQGEFTLTSVPMGSRAL